MLSLFSKVHIFIILIFIVKYLLLLESWNSQHSNYFDDIPSSTSIPSFSSSASSYLTDSHLTHFLPPTESNFTRFVPTSSASSFSSSSPYHTSIYPSPSPTPSSLPSIYSTSIYPSPSPAPSLPASSSQAFIPTQRLTTDLPYHTTILHF